MSLQLRALVPLPGTQDQFLAHKWQLTIIRDYSSRKLNIPFQLLWALNVHSTRHTQR